MGDGVGGAIFGSEEIGSVFSSSGVVFGELSWEFVNQKCFLLVAGLAEPVDRVGDPDPDADADAGLLARTSSPVATLFFAKLDGLGVAASAVLGRRLGLPSSLFKTKVVADVAGGLDAANELMLPLSE